MGRTFQEGIARRITYGKGECSGSVSRNIYINYLLMHAGQRKCSQNQVLDISWFGKERTQKARMLETLLENYNTIVLESQEKTEPQRVSELNAAEKGRPKVCPNCVAY